MTPLIRELLSIVVAVGLSLCNSHAMDGNDIVSCFSLEFGNVLNHGDHCVYVRAQTICCPVGDLELHHLMSLTKLKKC